MSKFILKLIKWQHVQSSVSGRAFILNLFILPSLIYFLSCWYPVKYQLKQALSLARSFLWGGLEGQNKQAKVSWETCYLPKFEGGLGILDLERLSTKLATKWIHRATSSQDYWALLLKRNIPKFRIQSYKAWTNLDLRSVLLVAAPITPVGSRLVVSMWNAWNTVKSTWCPTKDFFSSHLCFLTDSPQTGHFAAKLKQNLCRKSHKCHKAGIISWNDLFSFNAIKSSNVLQTEFQISAPLADWCRTRASKVLQLFPARVVTSPFNLSTLTYTIYKISHQKEGVEEQLKKKLNSKWKLPWSARQWTYRFKCIWACSSANKHSVLLWLLVHQGILSGARAAQIGVNSGLC